MNGLFYQNSKSIATCNCLGIPTLFGTPTLKSETDFGFEHGSVVSLCAVRLGPFRVVSLPPPHCCAFETLDCGPREFASFRKPGKPLHSDAPVLNSNEIP